jgi:flavin-dependent dehydrogenase
MNAEKTHGIVIAGGGLAGAAAACGLAQAGRAVTLIEREAQPVHKICGEFLSAEAQEYLARLGLDLATLGGAPISKLRLIRGAQVVSTDLPFHAIGVSRRRLDECLLLHAQHSGAELLRGQMVRSIVLDEKITLDVEASGKITPDVLLLATGKHELRGIKRDVPARKNLIGFKMYFRLRPQAQAALTAHIDLIFYPGGYAGLQMIEDGVANFCLLVDRDRYRLCGGSWETLLEYLKSASGVLADRLAGAAQLLAQPLTIYQVPYGFIHHSAPDDSNALFRLGDQACVIQSFTGDGMSIALHSAALAVRAVLRGDNAAAYHRQLARDIRGQIKRADILYALMDRGLAQAGLFGIIKLWPKSLAIAAHFTRVPRQKHVMP